MSVVVSRQWCLVRSMTPGSARKDVGAAAATTLFALPHRNQRFKLLGLITPPTLFLVIEQMHLTADTTSILPLRDRNKEGAVLQLDGILHGFVFLILSFVKDRWRQRPRLKNHEFVVVVIHRSTGLGSSI